MASFFKKRKGILNWYLPARRITSFVNIKEYPFKASVLLLKMNSFLDEFSIFVLRYQCF